MLRELKIENLAIIDELDIEFDKGFIVLTGETGAGKSIILSGINLLIGEKASIDMIRDGEENLVAQGIFDITRGDYGIPEDVVYGMPVTCKDGEYTIVEGLDIDAFSRERMDATLAELDGERDGVKHLVG